MKKTFIIVLAGLLVTLNAHATAVSGQGTWESTLQPRDLDGDTSTIEAFFDTVLNITWLADANFAQTSGFDSDGQMTWTNASAWANSLTVNGVAGWRLPTTTPIDGVVFNTIFSNNATTDSGYAASDGWVDGAGNPVSELGHLYYVALGNLGFCAPDNGAPSSCAPSTGWGLSNTGAFSNMQTSYYWTDAIQPAATLSAWALRMGWGEQDTRGQTNEHFAWAVHDGDVGAPVPAPAALWLLGSALLGLSRLSKK